MLGGVRRAKTLGLCGLTLGVGTATWFLAFALLPTADAQSGPHTRAVEVQPSQVAPGQALPPSAPGIKPLRAIDQGAIAVTVRFPERGKLSASATYGLGHRRYATLRWTANQAESRRFVMRPSRAAQQRLKVAKRFVVTTRFVFRPSEATGEFVVSRRLVVHIA